MELVQTGQGPLSQIFDYLAGGPVYVSGYQVSGWENDHCEEYQGIQRFMHGVDLQLYEFGD